MNPFILFVLLYISPVFLFAQEITFTKSESVPINSKSKIISGITQGEHGYYIRELNMKYNSFKEISTGEYKIHKISKDLKTNNYSEITIPFHSRKSKLKKIMILDNDLLVFSSYFDKKKKEKYIYLQKIDPITLNKVEEKETILKSKFRRGWQQYCNYFFKLSPDKSKLLIYEEDVYKGFKRTIHFCVIDKSSTKLWEESISLDKKNMIGNDIRDAGIDNYGNISFLANSKQKGVRKIFSIINCNIENKTIQEQIIKSNRNNLIQDVKIKFDSTSAILIGGFYSNANNKRSDGFLFGKWNFLDQNPKLTFTSFTDKFKKEGEKKYSLKSGMEKYNLCHFHLSKKGNIVLIGERVKKHEYDKLGSSGDISYFKYEFGNILYIEFRPNDLSIIRSGKIKKKRILESNFSRNFYFYEKENNFHFIFNDHLDNINNPEKKPKAAGGSNKNIAVNVEINSKGKLKYSSFSGNKIKEINPRKLVRVSENEILYTGQNKDKAYIFKFNLE